jgi:hypothetical protein
MITAKKITVEKYNLKDSLKVFGKQVATFPEGIGEMFNNLIRMLPDGDKRSWYGISKFTKNGGILYFAATEESFDGEAKKYGCDRYVIEKGEYLTETVNDWRKKTDCLKDVFHTLMQDSRVDKTTPCVEWYKNDDEMLCMIKMTAN